MGWKGKMVGGGLGFFIGGPLGAVAGAAFGHMFDSEENQELVLDESAFSSEERGQFTFFVATFSMLAKIAKIDGKVTNAEMASIVSFMSHDLNLNIQSRRVANQIFQQALNSSQPFSFFAEKFYREFHDNPDLLEMIIDIMMRVSAVDGGVHKSQDRYILQAVEIFKIPHSTYKSMRSRHFKSEASAYYSLLGCSPNDSNEAVRKQYLKMVRDFHPDTIVSKGLPNDFIEFANNRFREIQEAWEAIRTERNM